MYIAPGLLDRRLAFYRREENGGDGFARPIYVKTGIYWGRIDASLQRQDIPLSPTAHIEARTSLTAMVAEYVTVDPYGLVKQEGDETLYYIRGVIALRQLQAQRIDLEAVDPSSYNTFTIYDPAEVTDGEHLLLGATAFSTAFDEAFD
jgi:hypothetical protein